MIILDIDVKILITLQKKFFDFKNNIKKGKFDIKELTEIRRDILRHSKDIRGFLEEIRKDFNKSTTH